MGYGLSEFLSSFTAFCGISHLTIKFLDAVVWVLLEDLLKELVDVVHVFDLVSICEFLQLNLDVTENAFKGIQVGTLWRQKPNFYILCLAQVLELFTTMNSRILQQKSIFFISD